MSDLPTRPDQQPSIVRPVGTRRPRRTRAADPRGGLRSGRVLGGGIPRTVRPQATSMRWIPTSDQLELLASLLDAGLPFVEAMATLASMAGDPRTRSAAGHVRARLAAGVDVRTVFAEAGLPSHVRILIASGERTGGLPTTLRSAAALSSKLAGLSAETRRALVYPALVLGIGIAIMTVIAIAVVPPLERTFAELGGDLPRATRAVVAASRPLASPIVLMGVPGLMAVIIALRRWATSRSSGPRLRLPGPLMAMRGVLSASQRLSGALPDRLPLVGPLRHDLRLTVASHVMATLLRGGTSFDAALQHVADELSPSRTGELFAAAAAAVRSGTSPFSDEILGRVLDPGEREMLCIGERNGLLVEQWGRVAQRRDGALERRLHGLGATLEPLLIALVGFIVGGAVFALYLPTFRVMDLL